MSSNNSKSKLFNKSANNLNNNNTLTRKNNFSSPEVSAGNSTSSSNSNKYKTASYFNTSRNNYKLSLNSINQQVSSLSPITIFILVVIILILLYMLVNYIYVNIVNSRAIKVSNNVLLDTITDGMVPLDIGSEKLPNSSYSNEYALSLWVYVDDFNYKHGERKFILRRGNIKSVVNPEIYLHPTQNTLQVNISLSTDIHGNSPSTSSETSSSTTTTTLPVTELSQTTTTSSGATTTTTTATTNSNEPYLDIKTMGHDKVLNLEFFENKKDIVTSYNNIKNFVNNTNSDNTDLSQYYDNTLFDDVVNDNNIDNNEVTEYITHNPELNLVVEQFNDTSNSNCNCDDNSNTNESSEDRKNFEDTCGKCFVDNFPLQKWVHLVVSQYNNVIDVYIDGKLNSSCVLQGFPDVSSDNLILSPDGGFSGQMGNTVYYNTALSASDVYKVYIKGPEGSRNTGIMSTLNNIPYWVYVTIFVIIIAIILYSFYM
jgi:hypothetical protein